MKRKRIFLPILSILFLSSTVSMQTHAVPFGLQQFTDFLHNKVGATVGIGVFCLGGYALYKLVWSEKADQSDDSANLPNSEEEREKTDSKLNKQDSSEVQNPTDDQKDKFDSDSKQEEVDIQAANGDLQECDENSGDQSAQKPATKKKKKRVAFQQDHDQFNEFLKCLDGFVQSQVVRIEGIITQVKDRLPDVTENILDHKFTFVGGLQDTEIEQELVLFLNFLAQCNLTYIRLC